MIVFAVVKINDINWIRISVPAEFVPSLVPRYRIILQNIVRFVFGP